ncbi:MAG: glycosyltransferase [Bacteroidales bacterium]|jgi:hypothetical protein
MKFLIIQENGRHEKNRNFRECFCLQRALIKNNQVCEIWGLGHPNFSIFPQFNSYDIIIDLENYDSIDWIPDLSSVKAYKIIWNIDEHSRGSEYYQNKFVTNKCQFMLHATKDYVLTNTDIWFPNCFDDTLVYPKDVLKRADVGFCGNLHPSRNYCLNYLSINFNFIKDIFVIGEDMVNAINSYKIHFNKNISKDINYRNFETLGCRIPLVSNFNYQYDELGFKDGENCMLYADLDELSSKIKMLLSDNNLLNSLAENGYKLSQKHTYDTRARFLIEHLKHLCKL